VVGVSGPAFGCFQAGDYFVAIAADPPKIFTVIDRFGSRDFEW
jgi:hypothetical protein